MRQCDAGNPALAADPKSLAGKLLRIDTTASREGQPRPEHRGDRQAVSTHRGGICIGADARPW
ncbi:hypothetical protein [Kibdelosporangium philippinense]|uniref:hypothetical protein n=1 Tax=Kibdelosporangium philippinense TaxID=211113 RepID=UPI00360C9ED9